MPIDASIPLGAKAPDQMQSLSSLVNTANTAQQVQSNGISLNERKAVQDVLSNPQSYTDEQGNIDFTRAMPQIMRVAPTTGAKYVQDLMTAQKQHSDAQQSLNNLTTDIRGQMSKALYSLPPGASPDLVNSTLDQFEKLYKGAKPFVDTLRVGYQHAAQNGKADDFIANAAKTTIPQETQQAMDTPAGVTLDNGAQTTVVNLKPGVQNIAQGAPVPGTGVQKVLPPGQQQSVGNDAFGNPYVLNRDPHGNITGTGPVPGAANSPHPTGGPMAFPAGESQKTFDALQDERTTAKNVALQAPVMHDINKTIVQEASKPGSPDTGKWGALVREVQSRVPGMNDTQGATDYDVLGKMLERSALSAAQSMGPHTNAGLEAAVRANGSLSYTPQALKKIAYLNDALVSGSELYAKGLESAIQSSPNNVFAKRDFDRQWSAVADPQVLRLKNAVDQGNNEEISNIVKEVGGKGTKGAQQLHAKLQKLLQLTGK